MISYTTGDADTTGGWDQYLFYFLSIALIYCGNMEEENDIYNLLYLFPLYCISISSLGDL